MGDVTHVNNNMTSKIFASTIWFVIGAASIFVTSTDMAYAQSYPAKPVRMVAPYAPGGSSSAAAIVLSQRFQDLTGQALVIDYKPGAGSNIGSDLVAKSPPDGYVVLMGTSSLAINPSLYRRMSFDPLRDLTPVALLFSAANVLAVNPTLPIKSVQELIDFARANPGKLNYGSSGNGATNHMAMELLKHMAQIDIVHVAYKGSSLIVPALMANEVQVTFSPASSLQAIDKAGRVRMIAVSGTKPVPDLPLPTIASSGLPGFRSEVWFGLFAPAGTPPAVVSKLNADINNVLKDRQMLDVLEKQGMQAGGGTSDDMRKLLLEDHARWAGVIKATGIKAD